MFCISRSAGARRPRRGRRCPWRPGRRRPAGGRRPRTAKLADVLLEGLDLGRLGLTAALASAWAASASAAARWASASERLLTGDVGLEVGQGPLDLRVGGLQRVDLGGDLGLLARGRSPARPTGCRRRAPRRRPPARPRAATANRAPEALDHARRDGIRKRTNLTDLARRTMNIRSLMVPDGHTNHKPLRVPRPQPARAARG